MKAIDLYHRLGDYLVAHPEIRDWEVMIDDRSEGTIREIIHVEAEHTVSDMPAEPPSGTVWITIDRPGAP
jgi:hypothetical protein